MSMSTTLAFLGFVQLVAGCSRRDESRVVRIDTWRRGEIAVVESTAADFFESQVVEVTSTQLKIQKYHGGEILKVGIGDAYRIPAKSIEPPPNSWLICQMHPHVWSACRLVRRSSQPMVDAGVGQIEREFTVVDPLGEEQSLRGDGLIIEPSGLTAMNIQRRFAQSSRRVNFEKSLREAGGPRLPSGWQPASRRPVLARREGQWFGAQVVEIDDKRVVVRWDGMRSTTDLAREELAPQPPICGTVARGDRALRRPAGSGGAWTPVAVISVDESGVVVEDVERHRATLALTDLCPLGIAAQSQPNQ